MAIENIGSGGELRIQNLEQKIEKPRNLEFDASQDISESQMKEIAKYFLKEKNSSYEATIQAFDYALFAPLRPDIFNNETKEVIWERIKGQAGIDHESQIKDLLYYATVSLFGHPREVNENDFDYFVNQINEKKLWNVIQDLVKLKIIYPEKENLLTEEMVELAKKEFEEFVDGGFYLDAATIAATIKLMDPDKAKEFSFERYLQKAKEALTKESHCRAIIRYAFNLTVLTAKEVKISENGFDFVLEEENFEQKKPEMPQERNY